MRCTTVVLSPLLCCCENHSHQPLFFLLRTERAAVKVTSVLCLLGSLSMHEVWIDQIQGRNTHPYRDFSLYILDITQDSSWRIQAVNRVKWSLYLQPSSKDQSVLMQLPNLFKFLTTQNNILSSSWSKPIAHYNCIRLYVAHAAQAIHMWACTHTPTGPNLQGSTTCLNKVENNFQYILMKQSWIDALGTLWECVPMQCCDSSIVYVCLRFFFGGGC